MKVGCERGGSWETLGGLRPPYMNYVYTIPSPHQVAFWPGMSDSVQLSWVCLHWQSVPHCGEHGGNVGRLRARKSCGRLSNVILLVYLWVANFKICLYIRSLQVAPFCWRCMCISTSTVLTYIQRPIDEYSLMPIKSLVSNTQLGSAGTTLEVVPKSWQEAMCVCIGQIWPRLTEKERLRPRRWRRGFLTGFFQIHRFSRYHIWRASGGRSFSFSDGNRIFWYFQLSLHMLQVSKQCCCDFLLLPWVSNGGKHMLGVPWCILLINSRQLPP